MARLEIFVSAHCLGCGEARALAGAAAEQLPELAVSVTDIAALDAGQTLPDEVFAVPTYLLDGRRLFLGNPSLPELLARVRRLLVAPTRDAG